MSQEIKKTRKSKKARRPVCLAYISEPLRPLAVTVKSLHGDPDNVRTHPERNLAAIAASLREFGQQVPIVYKVIRANGRRRKVVIKGNGLLAAAGSLGWKHVAAVETALAGADATAYAIADNRTGDLSGFDVELLAAQLQELEEAEFDIEAIGYDDQELQELVDSVDDPRGRLIEDSGEREGGSAKRHRGERRVGFTIGHLKFELPRAEFDKWLAPIEAKVSGDTDRVVAEIKRRLKL